MKPKLYIENIVLIICFLFSFTSCKKIDEYNKEPDVEYLRDGIATSVAVGYCASVAMSAFRGNPLPSNMLFTKGNCNEFHCSGLIIINTSTQHPLPFNKNVGQIIIGGLWDQGNSGIISVVLVDISLLRGESILYGIYTVPVILQDDGSLLTLFAREDIIIGEGSDTILSLSFTKPQFDLEIERLNTEKPEDLYVAVKQNVWFVTVNQNHTFSEFLDDGITINGGGQMAEATDNTAGIIYHAVIETYLNYLACDKNPLDGQALIQYIVAGDQLDFKTLVLDFVDECDGKAKVIAATGKYIKWNGRKIPLYLN
ncbi:MAG: hypothetical protein JW973_02990 [Bacteroidales bacterium]|nr:hypothetical protein [Bacteroidales bacterium]